MNDVNDRKCHQDPGEHKIKAGYVDVHNKSPGSKQLPSTLLPDGNRRLDRLPMGLDLLASPLACMAAVVEWSGAQPGCRAGLVSKGEKKPEALVQYFVSKIICEL